MFKELAEYYQHTRDTIAKTLIKELLFLGGPEWSSLLEAPKVEDQNAAHQHGSSAVSRRNNSEILPKQVIKVYRGQTLLVDAPQRIASAPTSAEDSALNNVRSKSLRFYRGQKVN
jgi:hypothetical protein